MRLLTLLLVTAAVSGCGGSDPAAAPADQPPPSAARYSEQVRTTFLDACLDNAVNTANGAAGEEQLRSTCECILGRVEQEYTEAEFAAFEQRLLSGEAAEAESGRLMTWSTQCAQEATS